MTKRPKTNPKMLVYEATESPWKIGYGGNPGDDYGVIVSPHRERAICNLEPRDYKFENARLICAAPQLLKVAQKLLLWLEDCIPFCDFRFEFVQDEDSLYHELRQAIIDAGGLQEEEARVAIEKEEKDEKRKKLEKNEK